MPTTSGNDLDERKNFFALGHGVGQPSDASSSRKRSYAESFKSAAKDPWDGVPHTPILVPTNTARSKPPPNPYSASLRDNLHGARRRTLVPTVAHNPPGGGSHRHLATSGASSSKASIMPGTFPDDKRQRTSGPGQRLNRNARQSAVTGRDLLHQPEDTAEPIDVDALSEDAPAPRRSSPLAIGVDDDSAEDPMNIISSLYTFDLGDAAAGTSKKGKATQKLHAQVNEHKQTQAATADVDEDDDVQSASGFDQEAENTKHQTRRTPTQIPVGGVRSKAAMFDRKPAVLDGGLAMVGGKPVPHINFLRGSEPRASKVSGMKPKNGGTNVLGGKTSANAYSLGKPPAPMTSKAQRQQAEAILTEPTKFKNKSTAKNKLLLIPLKRWYFGLKKIGQILDDRSPSHWLEFDLSANTLAVVPKDGLEIESRATRRDIKVEFEHIKAIGVSSRQSHCTSDV
ncbi:hypothetical protein BOTBODRAFT_327536 [Botryobasidium botryosum FD-172 SS1]|uniref:Uncharacterized protein n=1 Tax=Botryobasidium botryosum (strain FD-172 SS1) TaxID=930990 RepID=A0A067MZ74_BOTB1|nr:hypothetical protein BOTBODRAFT_327536 [Botryobasidium botryosum FD-172 SS1]